MFIPRFFLSNPSVEMVQKGWETRRGKGLKQLHDLIKTLSPSLSFRPPAASSLPPGPIHHSREGKEKAPNLHAAKARGPSSNYAIHQARDVAAAATNVWPT